MVVYHLQKVSGKPGGKVNSIRLFGSFQSKISLGDGTSEKVGLFTGRKLSSGSSSPRVPFLQSFFDSSFRPSR